jgi:hypothetical protein
MGTPPLIILPSISKATALFRSADGCRHITGSAAFAKRLKTAVDEGP